MTNTISNKTLIDALASGDFFAVDDVSASNTTKKCTAAQIATYVGAGGGPVLGITDGSNAAAGYVGEVISSTLAFVDAIALTTNTIAEFVSIPLTAGDWEIDLLGTMGGAGGNPSNGYIFIGTAPGDNTTGQDLAANTFKWLTVGGSTGATGFIRWRVNITVSTTYYGKAYTLGSRIIYGTIRARRIR